MVTPEVKHGIYLILYAFTQPTLCILVNSMKSIPSAGRITGGITVFSYRAGTYLYPGLQSFHTFVEVSDDFRNVIPAPLGEVASFAIFPEIIGVWESGSILRITQIIEVDAIHVIFFHNLAYKAHQIFFGCRISGIEEVFTLIRHTNSGFLFGYGGIAQIGNMLAIA